MTELPEPSFYHVMKYPVPNQGSMFLYIDEADKYESTMPIQDTTTSWNTENPLLHEYINHINKYKWLYQSLPFVRQIYLCNSISFNALHEQSDIDLYIISQTGFIRLARFRSVLFFFLAKLKRSKKNVKMKFCLSFYSDEKNCNLYHLRNHGGDKYLSYWIGHAVLLYTDDTLSDNYLRENNKELLDFIPYHPRKQIITIGSTVYRGNSILKKIIEILLHNKIGKIIQYIIRSIRTPIILYKKGHFKNHTQKDIIVSDTMLKFHNDQRELFEFRQKSRTRKER